MAHAAGVPIAAEDATTKPDEMAAFLTRLREKHAADRALLIVGHSNTVPELLVKLGAKPECFQRLGIVTGTPKLPPCWTLIFPPPTTKGRKSWKKS